MGQAHKVCVGVKPVSGRPTLPLTWDSGVIKDNVKQITIKKQRLTTTGLQAPDLGQAHKVCGGVKPVSERLILPLTLDSGTTAQQ